MDKQNKNINKDIEAKTEEGKNEVKKNIPISFHSLENLGGYINYIEEPTLLEFAEAVKDTKGNILIQKGTKLRPTIFTLLKSRNPSELPAAFIFSFTKDLKEKCKSLIRKNLFTCLDPNRIHIAPNLLQMTNLDYIALANTIMDNRSILDLLTRLNRNNDTILPHLGETALLSASIADHLCLLNNIGEQYYKRIVKQSLLAGLLHDISISDNVSLNVQNKDINKENHEKHSVKIIMRELPGIEPGIIMAIGNHHRKKRLYVDEVKSIMSPDEIILESLSFAEFFFEQTYSITQSQKSESGKAIEKIFFYIGQCIGNGFFHPMLFKIMGNLQSKFKAILKYGNEIGGIELECPFGNSAVAYPTPRCAQILCKDRNLDCDKLIHNFPIRVVAKTKSFGRMWMLLDAGDYPKCRLSDKLPDPPDELKSI